MNLSKCKSCGANVALNTKKCPHCGARVFHPIFGLAVAGVLLVMLFPFLFFSKNRQQPSSASTAPVLTPSPTPTVQFSISAKDLWKAYSDNKVNADNLYKDKLLAVTGTITDIGQDVVTKAPCVSLNTGDSIGLYAIQCFFPKGGAQNDLLAGLSDGDEITIYGTCEGTPILQVQLSGCYLDE